MNASVTIRVRVRKYKQPVADVQPEWRVERANDRLVICRKDNGEMARFRRRDGREVYHGPTGPVVQPNARRIVPSDLIRVERFLNQGGVQ